MIKARSAIVLFAIVLFAVNAFAIYDWQRLDQNNLMSAETNYGVLGQALGASGPYAFWPSPALDSSGNIIPPAMNYVYGWGLWVGAQVKTTRSIGGITLDTMVTIGYNPNNATSEFAPGAVLNGVPQTPANSSAKVYVSDEFDWPLMTYYGQDSIISDRDTRCSYNDYLISAHASGGVPLKVEVTQTTYQWNTPTLQDIIYFLFEVKNTGTDTLYNVYLAPTADCDIGYESGAASNDVCYFDTTTNMAYQYQTSPTEVGWSRTPGCVGISFLQGPIATKNYTLPDARQIFAGDTLGLTHFKIFNIAVDPVTDITQYKELAGYTYTTGNYVPFDPKPAPGDQRFAESTGPIDIAPGQTAKVVVCLICANFDYTYMNINDTLAIKELRDKARAAKIQFDQLGVSGFPNEISATSLRLHQNTPNPFKQLTMINYQLAKPGLVNLKVYNIAGQLVKTLVSGQAGAGPHSVKWDGRDNGGNKVSSGIYIYRLQAENKDMTRKLVILR